MSRNSIDDLGERFENNPIGCTFVGLLVLAVVGGLISFLFWGGSVLFSDFFGAGNAQKQINSVDNRLGQYDHFFQLDKDIRSQAQAAALAQKQLDAFNKTNPPSPSEGFQISEQRTNLQNQVLGPEQLCQTNVATYNNDAVKYTAAKFKDANLPASFDASACTDPSKLPASANPNAN